MNKLAALIFALGVVNLSCASTEEDGIDIDSSIDFFPSSEYEYVTREAKEVSAKLDSFMRSKVVELEQVLDKLEKENSALETLKNYHATVKLAEGTQCSVDPPKGLADAERTITTATDSCSDTIVIDDFDKVTDAVAGAYDEIERIDQSIADNYESCSSEEGECADKKKSAIAELNSILSPEFKTQVDSLIYSMAKEALDVCLQIVTEDLQKELDYHTRNIKECLSLEPVLY